MTGRASITLVWPFGYLLGGGFLGWFGGIPVLLIGLVLQGACTGDFASIQMGIARPALEALREISTATKNNVNQSAYEQLLFKAETKVMRVKKEMANHEFKIETEIALLVYNDALLIWRVARNGEISDSFDEVKMMKEKYDLSKAVLPASDGKIIYDQTKTLSAIWAVADEHLKKAEYALIPRENYRPF